MTHRDSTDEYEDDIDDWEPEDFDEFDEELDDGGDQGDSVRTIVIRNLVALKERGHILGNPRRRARSIELEQYVHDLADLYRKQKAFGPKGQAIGERHS